MVLAYFCYYGLVTGLAFPLYVIWAVSSWRDYENFAQRARVVTLAWAMLVAVVSSFFVVLGDQAELGFRHVIAFPTPLLYLTASLLSYLELKERIRGRIESREARHRKVI